jgi:hypothetical protein
LPALVMKKLISGVACADNVTRLPADAPPPDQAQ